IAVDADRRQRIAVHHSATHLLHAALREVLGPHVKQAGSAVGEDKLRFDFTHFQAMSPAELEAVETLVNEKVRANLAVGWKQMGYEEAVRSGAMAIFEEKYGDRVRVVEMEGFTRELCGGTHLSATGEIGLFKILSESSISAGMRRIEAIGGQPALVWVQGQLHLLHELAARFNQKPEALPGYLDSWEASVKERERELKKRASPGAVSAANLATAARQLKGIPITVASVPGVDRKALSVLADETKGISQGIAILFTNEGEKSALVTSIQTGLTDRWNSNNIVKRLAVLIGGKGGGRPDFAQAGGDLVADPDRLIGQIWNELEEII
ncbi:MAG TPA: DHHA1 domain-containing protein, partial [Candidatus Aminicenantes bacterium]|nr:DHHA1 domain-containing protein [Candidatus Aminicenantes bacterium]